MILPQNGGYTTTEDYLTVRNCRADVKVKSGAFSIFGIIVAKWTRV
jgi:hypothetical protein